MPDLYEMEHESEVQMVLDHFRSLLAPSVGVTNTGNQMILRTYMGSGLAINPRLVQIHAIITSVKTPSESMENQAQRERFEALKEKYKIPSSELHYAEYGVAK
jgi:hypothetical protein